MIGDELPPFADPALLERALTHSSWAHENGGEDNERLEFVGDAVLQLCSTLVLAERFPDAREGELSRLRQHLVSTGALATLGRRLGIGAELRLGVGEAASGGRDRTRTLAGATEAVLGAVFLDAGYAAAEALVRRWTRDAVEELAALLERRDPRSLLQEQVQRDLGETPVYDVTGMDGPPHQPTFSVVVRVGERVLGRGTGPSKREASRRAAEAALFPAGPEGQS